MNGFLTNTEAAKVLGKHPATLANWRTWHRGPKFTKKGRRILYREADIKRWQAANGD
jgi:hypothetical protein